MKQLCRILFLLIGGVFILGQFGRFELPGARAIYFQDVLIGLFDLFFLIGIGKKQMQLLLMSSLGKVFVFLNIWIIFTSVFNFHDNRGQLLTAALYLFRFDAIVLFGVGLVSMVKKKVVVTFELTQWLTAATVGIALLGFLQYIFFPDTRGLKLLGWDDHYYRLISTIFDPGFTGIILVIGSFLLLRQLLRKRSWPFITFYLLSTLALLLTYSRASYLAFVAGIIFLAWRSKKYFLLVIIPIFMVCILFLPRPGGEGVKLERTASAVSRIDSVTSSFSQFSPTDFMVGKGWYWKKEIAPTSIVDDAVVPNHSSAAENSYVFIFTSLGVVGTILSLSLVYLFLNQWRWNTEVIAVILAIGVHALFTNTFFYPFVLILLAVITAKNAPEYLVPSRQPQH